MVSGLAAGILPARKNPNIYSWEIVLFQNICDTPVLSFLATNHGK
jgi:hypothetical protein